MPVFRVCSFLGASPFCRINLDNHVLLVSYVDLLKTEFTISLSVLRVDHRFPLLEMNIFLFQLEFSSFESTEAFTKSSDTDNCFFCRQKRPIIPSANHRLNFLFKETEYQNHNLTAIDLLVQQVTKKNCKENRLSLSD